MIDANRANYTQNVVDKLHTQGVVEALEHWKEEKGRCRPISPRIGPARGNKKDMKLSFRLASLTPSTSGTDRTANSNGAAWKSS